MRCFLFRERVLNSDYEADLISRVIIPISKKLNKCKKLEIRILFEDFRYSCPLVQLFPRSASEVFSKFAEKWAHKFTPFFILQSFIKFLRILVEKCKNFHICWFNSKNNIPVWLPSAPTCLDVPRKVLRFFKRFGRKWMVCAQLVWQTYTTLFFQPKL